MIYMVVKSETPTTRKSMLLLKVPMKDACVFVRISFLCAPLVRVSTLTSCRGTPRAPQGEGFVHFGVARTSCVSKNSYSATRSRYVILVSSCWWWSSHSASCRKGHHVPCEDGKPNAEVRYSLRGSAGLTYILLHLVPYQNVLSHFRVPAREGRMEIPRKSVFVSSANGSIIRIM